MSVMMGNNQGDMEKCQIAKKLHHNGGNKVHIFTNDGNQIIGTIRKVEDGVVKLKHATVFKNFKRRLTNVSIYVAIAKIDSFSIMHRKCH